MILKLINSRVEFPIIVEHCFIDKEKLKPLAHEDRAFDGTPYISYLGRDYEYSIKGRVGKILNSGDDKNYKDALEQVVGDLVTVEAVKDVKSLSPEDKDQAELEDGEYKIDSLKYKEFSKENEWYHVEFVLSKYFTK